MQQQVALCDNRLQSPSWHHGGDVSGVQFFQEGVRRRKPGIVLEEYLRFQMSEYKQRKIFTGNIERDGILMNVHYGCLMADRPILSLSVPLTEHEKDKEVGPRRRRCRRTTLSSACDTGNTNIVTIAATNFAEDGIDGNLRQRDMRLLKLSRARYYRDSGKMNARKQIVTWNAGVKEHLEAVSQVTSRRADR